MLEKKCRQCGGSFIPTKKKHFFCSTPCKRKYYWLNVENSNAFPKFICDLCGEETKLDFYIKKEPKKWELFLCPKCGKKVN